MLISQLFSPDPLLSLSVRAEEEADTGGFRETFESPSVAITFCLFSAVPSGLITCRLGLVLTMRMMPRKLRPGFLFVLAPMEVHVSPVYAEIHEIVGDSYRLRVIRCR
ncbi:hypothetical protein N7499_012213 [Penicillium canescens]|uniref:Uncharacterized protein n=1 Tax=Penicillium canescens TaxID=5083 RepID=A0AAD6I4F3_PENCN|nr:uncharacterized protein N7446_001139 [Penicillium canescens]KAJ6029804.1 hypothetical protein N7460_010070 [Penicillium canescens]KAJ6063533.1 hypothetical protein N7499_012213 [Penicillium canescens]KAJ6078203.1 hypothetical protein N7446_001139 [Penicillium canescens]